MNPQEIGETIKQTRRRLNLLQSELASVAGLSVRTLSEIENGKETTQIGLVLQVLDSLAIEVKLQTVVDQNISGER